MLVSKKMGVGKKNGDQICKHTHIKIRNTHDHYSSGFCNLRGYNYIHLVFLFVLSTQVGCCGSGPWWRTQRLFLNHLGHQQSCLYCVVIFHVTFNHRTGNAQENLRGSPPSDTLLLIPPE
jgi:hypothetical protein